MNPSIFKIAIIRRAVAVMRTVAAPAGLAWLLCSCGSCPPAAVPVPDAAAEREGRVFWMDPRQPWNPTGYDLQSNAVYRFTAVAAADELGRPYQDASICCTPDGPVGFRGSRHDWRLRNPHCPLNPVFWAGSFGYGKITRLRVLADRQGQRASFLTVIGAIGTNDCRDNVFVIGRHAEIVAHAGGKLFLFANDWPGGDGIHGDERFRNSVTYSNNTGRVRVIVERIK